MLDIVDESLSARCDSYFSNTEIGFSTLVKLTHIHTHEFYNVIISRGSLRAALLLSQGALCAQRCAAIHMLKHHYHCLSTAHMHPIPSESATYFSQYTIIFSITLFKFLRLANDVALAHN
jgi:hypothetical protein